MIFLKSQKYLLRSTRFVLQVAIVFSIGCLISSFSEIGVALASPPTIHGSEGVPLRLKQRVRKKFSKRYRCRKLWDLHSDGTIDSRRNRPVVTYPDNGLFSATVQVVCYSRRQKKRLVHQFSVQKNIRIRNKAPRAKLAKQFSGVAGREIQLNGSGKDQGQLDRATGFVYTWKFGDRSAPLRGANLRSVQHTYNSPGKYTLRLIVEDKDGGVSRVSRAQVRVRRGKNTILPPSSPGGGKAVPVPTMPPGRKVIRVTPSESTEVFANPGMGWQSNNRIEHDSSDLNNSPISVAYFKYYWDEIEKGPGKYDFSKIDQDIFYATRAGQKIDFRIMVVDEQHSAPKWLRNLGARGTSYKYYGDGNPEQLPRVWSVDLEDPIFQQYHFAFLQALGKRYNNHPGVNAVDIGTVGLWGEWHFGEVTPAISMPSRSTMRKIIDAYVSAFSNTPLMAQLTDLPSLKYAVQRGAGFGGDCLGNMNYQMKSLYPNNIRDAGAQNAWMNGPVRFESCWVMQTWVNKGWDPKYILNWALSQHISTFNNKNNPIPSGYKKYINQFLKQIGYRYVIQELTHPAWMNRGEDMFLGLNWQNVGVAPLYNNFILAFQLRSSNENRIIQFPISGHVVKNWMPGIFQTDSGIQIPKNIPAGTYKLAVGIIDPNTNNPVIRLANTGGESSFWYPLSTVSIR